MLKNDLVTLLAGLSKDEIKKLGKFVNSPYFNTNSKASEMFDVLKPFYPEFDSEKLTKQFLYAELYGSGKFVEGTVNYLLSELQQLTEDFISIETTNKEIFDLSFLKYLSDNSQEKLFHKNYDKIEKRISKSQNKLYEFLLADLLGHQIDSEKRHLTKRDHYRNEWLDPSKLLINFFVDAMLAELILLANYRNTLNTSIEIPLLNEIITFLERSPSYLNDSITSLNFHLIKILVYFDEKSYTSAKELIKKRHKDYHSSKCSEALNAFQIFCSKKLLDGEDYRKEEFEIAKLRLEVTPYSAKKNIGVDVFYKTFMLAISVSEFKWAEEFVKRYSKLIPEKFRNNAVHYSNARILYQKKQYDKALQELSKIGSFTFIHYKPAVKILQMMILFDTGHFMEAEDAANAFIQFLRQDKLIPEGHKKEYQKFIKYYLLLVNAVSDKRNSKIIDASSKINALKGFLIGRKWFGEKLEALNGKKTKGFK